jgi:Pyridine nucleotide-disulphide oxidoreductase
MWRRSPRPSWHSRPRTIGKIYELTEPRSQDMHALAAEYAKVRVYAKDMHGERMLEGTDVLVATGRTANTDGIGLERTGVGLKDHGYIKVNERLQTTAANIWAAGDCAGSPEFTHVAYDDCRLVYDHLNGGHRTTRNRLIPFCLFIDPELVRVGRNESEPMVDVLRLHDRLPPHPRHRERLASGRVNGGLLGARSGKEGTHELAHPPLDEVRSAHRGPGLPRGARLDGAHLSVVRVSEVVRVRGPDLNPLYQPRAADFLDVPGVWHPRGQLASGGLGMGVRRALVPRILE